ncbi:MAG: response regulator [Ignavibacteria bacterium]
MNRVFKILVIDDSDILCTAIRKFFENYDFDVITCNNGLDGISIASNEKPDVIFLDLLMPNFNGLDVLKSIKILDDCQNIPIVIITGYHGEELIEEVIKLGVTKVINKPIRRNDVVNVIDNIIGNHAMSKLRYEKYYFEPQLTKKDITDKKYTKGTQIKFDLIKLFLKSVDRRINELRTSIKNKNEIMLKVLFHELKSSGTMIGYNRLTLISSHIEELFEKGIDEKIWKEVELYTNQTIDILTKIKKENGDDDIPKHKA